VNAMTFEQKCELSAKHRVNAGGKAKKPGKGNTGGIPHVHNCGRKIQHFNVSSAKGSKGERGKAF